MSAARAASLNFCSVGSHASPSRTPPNVRPSLHGTYSCGYQSRAIVMCRLISPATTGSRSASSRTAWGSSTYAGTWGLLG